MQLSGVLKLMYPVEHGLIEDWTAMEKIWHYMFYTDMRIDPSEHPVALLVRDMTPRRALEKIAEILFETFNVPALCLVSDGSAAMAQAGKRTGIAVVIEDNYTSIVPCFNGFPISHAIQMPGCSLHAVQDHLRRLLIASGKISKDLYWRRIYMQDIVDKLGSAFGREGSRPPRKATYVLPDGESIAMESECDKCFDVYFRSDPAAFGFEGPTVQEAIVQSIEDAMAGWDDEAGRKEFVAALAPITVVGPAARFPGIQERLTREFNAALPRAWRGGGKGGRPSPPDLSAVRFLVPDRPDIATWRGLSRIARASTGNPRVWVQRREYLDNGPTLVHRLNPQEYVGK